MARRKFIGGELLGRLEDCRSKLLAAREKRIRPQLDDKVLLGWNALMNSAFSAAYAALGDDHYRDIAEKNMMFLFNTMVDPSSGKLNIPIKTDWQRWMHSWMIMPFS